MKVLVVGSGAREHALVWKIAQSPKVTKVYAAPGNGGIARSAETPRIAADNINDLLEFAKREKIDLTVVGPESPLVEGIVDLFEAEGLRIFGPRRDLAVLEGSKVYAKRLMSSCGVPTASFEVFEESGAARAHILKCEMPVVVKADGLCAGKGVVICKTPDEAMKAINDMMDEKSYGSAGNTIVIEECLEGEEASIMALVDGTDFIFLASSQDHKRAYDGDRGPNTGGMGAYSPAPVVTDEVLDRVAKEIVAPFLSGIEREGKHYKGVLYIGIMLTKAGPKVLEFNVRFGDPEAEAILPRLKSDLVEAMERVIDGKLKGYSLDWDTRACVSVVIASGGYPGFFVRGKEIYGIESFDTLKDAYLFHGGTKKGQRRSDGVNLFVTTGGRVFALTALGATIKEAVDSCYALVDRIRFSGMHFRKDIGNKALGKGAAPAAPGEIR